MSTNSDTLFYGEHPIDMSPKAFGELRESNDILDDAAALSGASGSRLHMIPFPSSTAEEANS